MSGAEATRAYSLLLPPVDLGWRNIVLSLRTVLAALVALAVSYWLNLQDPQWSVLTVYLVAQPTAGAAVAKGVYRILGTVAGALWGLVALALFAEAAVPFVATMVLWLGLCIYAATRSRNFVSYGFLLAGYTALLVGYEGALAPTAAWTIAVDRSTEIALGIACAAAVALLIMPRYAGDVLRESLADTLAGLAGYGATAMRPTTPMATFMTLRARIIAEVVQFDALRSYTAFESPAMQANSQAVQRVVHEFLAVLAVARGLYFRLDDFRKEQGGVVLQRLTTALDDVAETLRRIAARDSDVAEPRQMRAALLAARLRLGTATDELEALAGSVPLDPLANGLLVIRRAGDLLHGLSMVLVVEVAATRAVGGRLRRRPAPQPADRADAAAQGLRAALALLIVSVFWAATAWHAGFSAVAGLAIMLLISVNQNDPARIGWPYLGTVIAALAAAYVAIVAVLPWLGDFQALAIFLAVVLFPVGIVAGTPQIAMSGVAFGAFFLSEIGTGNRFQPDALTYVNSAFGLVAGMAACLAVLVGLLPVDPASIRRRARAGALRRLPIAARGEQPERVVANEIFSILAGLLPRLNLARETEDLMLRGLLGTASVSLELGRLHRRTDDPALPEPARAALTTCLAQLAGLFARLADRRQDGAPILAEAEAVVATARAALAEVKTEPASPAARQIAHAAASLRFVADRFVIDRWFLLGSAETA